jgi:hypothetical protein
MPEFGEFTPYDMFAAVWPRLLKRPAGAKAVSQLGQAVSDALDKGCSDRDVQLMIADLEAERERVSTGDSDDLWTLPLTGLLGVLRQTLHNRAVMPASLDPGNEMLRDRVVMAIDVGTNTPAAIAALLRAPTTVVCLVMHQLTDAGLIEPAEPAEDQRQRPYRRVENSDPVANSVWPEAEDDERNRRVEVPVWEAEGTGASADRDDEGTTDDAAAAGGAETTNGEEKGDEGLATT